MRQIVGVCLSQFHDDSDTFEMLLSYADGREIGHSVARNDAEKIAAEFLTEVDAFAAKDAEIARLTAENEKLDKERRTLRSTVSDLLIWYGKRGDDGKLLRADDQPLEISNAIKALEEFSLVNVAEKVGGGNDPYADAKAYLASRPQREPTQVEIDESENCGGFF